jgi:hypothetical protein
MNAPATTESSGQLVAVQYPETVTFLNVADAAQLATDYGALVSIDADSAGQYKKLTAAIKAVSAARLHIDKEEKRLKDPANAFAKMVLGHAKRIREPFKELETNLKAEKKRVDDIQQEKLAEQKKLWESNLKIISGRGQNLFHASMEQLQNELAIIDSCNLGDFDFGDLEEDAKAELANARIRTEGAIEQEKAKLKLAAEQEAFRLQQEEQAKADAAKKLISDEEAAYIEYENRELKAKLAAAEEKAEAAKVPEPTPEPEKPVTVDAIAEACGLPARSPHIEKTAPPADNSDFDDEPAPVLISAEDASEMDQFIARINGLIESAPVDFKDQDFGRAIDRVCANLKNAAGYLLKVKNGGVA